MMHTYIKQEKGFEKDLFILVGRGRVNKKWTCTGSKCLYVTNFKKTPQPLQQLANSVQFGGGHQRPNVDNVETRTKNVFKADDGA